MRAKKNKITYEGQGKHNLKQQQKEPQTHSKEKTNKQTNKQTSKQKKSTIYISHEYIFATTYKTHDNNNNNNNNNIT